MGTQPAVQNEGTKTYVQLPHTHHATASRVVKGEDVLVVHPLNISPPGSAMMYMVCDGHAGPETANFVAANFLRILHTKMPTRMPDFNRTKDTEVYAENVRKAVCETFVRLDNEWSNYGHLSGTTVTVALTTGWLLTVANAGDSGCVLDTGSSMLEMINSHRIHTSMREQARLKEARQYVASLGFHLQGPAKPGEPGVGPLRIWPGGLCVARSVGDLDAGPEIVPVPHIRQVMMPPQGCRLILASDGLWDLVTYSKAVTMTRSKPTSAATAALIQVVSRDLRVMDDASIVVVDMLPSERTSFPTVALRSNPGGAKKKSKSSGLFSCFKPETEEPDSRETTGVGHLQFLSNVDCLLEYPGLRNILNRSSLNKSTVRRLSEARHSHAGPVDFTLHGGKVYTSDGTTLLASSHGRGTDRSMDGGPYRDSVSKGGTQHGPQTAYSLPLARSRADSSNSSGNISRAAQMAMMSARGISAPGSKADPVSPRHCSSAENTVHAELPSHAAATGKGLTPLEQALQGDDPALHIPSPDSTEHLSGSNVGGSSRGGKSRFLYQQYQQQQQQQLLLQQRNSMSLQGQSHSRTPSSLEDVAEEAPSSTGHANRTQYRVVKTVEVGGGKMVRQVELAGGGEQIGEQRMVVGGLSVNTSQTRHSGTSRPDTGDSVLSEGEVTVHEGQGALAALQLKQQGVQH